MSIDKRRVWGETPLKTLIFTQCASSVMADNPTSGRDLTQSATWAGELFAQPDDPNMAPLPETDLTELAAKFAAPTGPALAPDLAMDLALQMVLHEIVEEACEGTAATGAAVALYHDGELVCRASHGVTAPPLGAGLDVGVGLSGECLRTRQIQLCSDVQTDGRVDFDACSRLGVYSVVVLPLLGDEGIMGIFEVLSSRPSAFDERDIGMLKAFADRILKNLQRAARSSGLPVAESLLTDSLESALPAPETVADAQAPEVDGSRARWADVATWALAIVVVACAGWLSVRAIQRFASQRYAPQRAAVPRPPTGVSSSPTEPRTSLNASNGSNATAGSRESSSPSAPPSAPAVRNGAETSHSTRRTESRVPEGGLLVYENGREVFRMPPSGGTGPPSETGVVQASSVQAEKVLELSASAAESGLVHRVEPEYPEEARAAGIQGAVVLEVRIRPDGTVEQLTVVSGQPVLANAAMTAVKQWRFKPRQAKGQAAEMQTTITLNFRLPT